MSGAAGARVVPWAVLALGLATTAFLYGSISRTIQGRNQREYVAAQRVLVADVNFLVRRQVSLLHAAAGAIEAHQGMTQNQFAIFYGKLTLGDTSFAPEAIGFSRRVPWAQRDRLKAEAVLRGVTNFDFRPPGPRDEAHAIMLIEPLDDGNLSAPGYDMHAERVRRAAMDAASRRHDAAMTPRVTLAKDGDRGKGIPSVIVYVPVNDPATGEISGYVYSGLHTTKLFGSLFPPSEMGNDEAFRKGIGLRLWTGAKDDAHLVFSHPVSQEVVHRSEDPIELESVGGTLAAEIDFTGEFGTKPVIQKNVPPVGTIISLMLFLLARSLGLSHEATERRAREQGLLNEVGRLTASTPEDEESLVGIARSVSLVFDAVCRIDILRPDGSLRTVNTRTGDLETAAAIERDFPRTEHDPVFRAARETGASQHVDEVSPADAELRARLVPFGIGSVLVVPMQVRGRFLGAITLVRRRGQRRLSREAVAITEAIAGRLALALDNASLYRAAQQEVQERRAAEAEVRRLNEDLEEIVAERTRDLEASNHELESFCYSVSHDLRTPLRSLDGFGRALKEDYGEQLDEQAHDYIDRIRASTKRMDELITALLTLSRLTRREIVPADVDATAMAKETMADLDPNEKVAFRVEEGLRVHADPRMLGVVLENLLGNAIKFSSRVERPEVTVGRAEDGSIFVRDNGAGFDPAYGSKLFLPFERLHSVREFPGHGIGLATVERILRRHGGEVRAEGRAGEGATFYVRFPT